MFGNAEGVLGSRGTALQHAIGFAEARLPPAACRQALLLALEADRVRCLPLASLTPLHTLASAGGDGIHERRKPPPLPEARCGSVTVPHV